MKLRLFVASLALSAVPILTQASEFQLGSVTVADPHARATTTGQTTGGAYLKLTNRGAADRLLSVKAAVAGSVELHSMSMEGDVMRMRQIDAIALPAGKTVELKPGGLHIMFVGLKAPLKAGDKFPLTLKFEKAGDLTVTMEVDSADHAAHKH